MAKQYEKPEIKEVETPKSDASNGDDDQVTINGNKTEKVEKTLTDIYKDKIYLFRDFLNGTYAANNLTERSEAQNDFINFFFNMLEAEYPVMRDCMNELLKVVKENPVPFSHENVFAPYWGMKVKPNSSKSNPYIQFITFVIGLSANMRRRPAFIKGIDVTSFLSLWNEKQKQNLNRYIYD